MDLNPVPDPEGQKNTDPLHWFQIRHRNSPLYGMHSTVDTKEKDSRNRKILNYHYYHYKVRSEFV
jgi:hypothetical protein